MTHRESRSSFLLLILLILLILAGPSLAAGTDRPGRRQFDAIPLTSRWRVFGGSTFSTVDTEVGFTPTGLIEGLIRLEDDLGLDERVNAYVVGASVRIAPHHRLELSLSSIDRESRQELDKRFEFGDYVFDVGAEVRTKFRVSLAKFKWKYSLSDSGRLDAGLTAGLSAFDLKISLDGQGMLAIGGGGAELREAREGAQFIAPVPLVGFYLDYAFAPRVIMRVGADALDLHVGEHRGRVLESDILLEVYVSDLAGIGVGLATSDIEYGRNVDQERLEVRYRTSNLVAYFTYVF